MPTRKEFETLREELARFRREQDKRDRERLERDVRLEALLRSADTSVRQFGDDDVPLPLRAWDTAELMEEYLAEAGPANWSPDTVAKKRWCLPRFAAHTPRLPASRQEVTAFVESQLHHSFTTKKGRFANIKAYLRWCQRVHRIPAPDLSGLYEGEIARRDVVLTFNEAQRFPAAAAEVEEGGREISELTYRTNLCLGRLILATGMRATEACTLERENVKTDHVVVYGKREPGSNRPKEMVKPVPADLAREPLALPGCWGALLDPDRSGERPANFVFSARGGIPMNRGGPLPGQEDAAPRRAGTHPLRRPPHAAAHLRHAGTGADWRPALRQQSLGHAESTTTERYAKHSNGRVAQIVAASPLFNVGRREGQEPDPVPKSERTYTPVWQPHGPLLGKRKRSRYVHLVDNSFVGETALALCTMEILPLRRRHLTAFEKLCGRCGRVPQKARPQETASAA